LGAALGHLGEAVAQPVELRIDRLLGGQLLVGVPLLGDQLTADLGGTDAGEEAVCLEFGVGLALAIDDRPDIVEQSRQVLLGGFPAAEAEGIDAGHSASEFVQGLTDRPPVPPKMGLRPELSASAHGHDGLGHEGPSLATFEGLGGVDQDGDHLGCGPHRRGS
jgi:hypothetical protein